MKAPFMRDTKTVDDLANYESMIGCETEKDHEAPYLYTIRPLDRLFISFLLSDSSPLFVAYPSYTSLSY